MNNLKVLRYLIQEYALAMGRNYHTIDNDPYSWKEMPGIDVESYSLPDQGHFVSITVDEDPSLSISNQVFNDEADAEMFARKQVERIKVDLMNRGLMD